MFIAGNKKTFRTILFVGIILILALGLRSMHLGKYTLWFDEAVTALARGGVEQAPLLSTQFDGDFAAQEYFYLFSYATVFIHYWQKLFGSSEFAMRFSSVIFSLLGIYLLFVLGKKMIGEKTARIAIIILLISPFHIYYAQELRPYSAISFLGLVAALAFFKGLEDRKKIYWVIYTVACGLMVYFHYLTLLLVFAFAIFFLLRIQQHPFALDRFLVANLFLILMLIPLFVTIFPLIKIFFQSDIQPALSEFPVWAGQITPTHLFFTFKNMALGYNISYYTAIGKIYPVFFFFFFLLGAVLFFKKPEMKFLLICIVAPIVSLFSLSIYKTFYVDRYFFNIFPFYVLCMAAGLSKLKNFFLFGSMLVIISVNSYALYNYYTNNFPHDEAINIRAGIVNKQDLRGMVQVMANRYQIGDRIMHATKVLIFPLKFYIRQGSAKADLIREADKGTVLFVPDHKSSPQLLHYDRTIPVFSSQAFDFKSDLSGIERLWFVFSGGDESLIGKIEERGFETELVEVFHNGVLYLFNHTSEKKRPGGIRQKTLTALFSPAPFDEKNI